MTTIQLAGETISTEPHDMDMTRRNRSESLVPEDGSISARSLPLDIATAGRDYETATFGMG